MYKRPTEEGSTESNKRRRVGQQGGNDLNLLDDLLCLEQQDTRLTGTPGAIHERRKKHVHDLIELLKVARETVRQGMKTSDICTETVASGGQ